MSRLVDDPDLTLPAFEPRFGERRPKDRGGIDDARFTDGRLSRPPPNSMLDSLPGTFLALDPLLAALVIAGHHPRELVVGTSNFGNPAAQAFDFFRTSQRSGRDLPGVSGPAASGLRSTRTTGHRQTSGDNELRRPRDGGEGPWRATQLGNDRYGRDGDTGAPHAAAAPTVPATEGR